jgi:hypothetical protein
MFGKWFSRKDKDVVSRKEARYPFGEPVREPRSNWSDRRGGKPPAGADRDFVYHER